MSDIWFQGLEMPSIDMLKEGQMSGALSGRIAQLFVLANDEGYMSQAPISIDPGDMAFVGSDEAPGIALSLPIAYDVWYLWHTVNIIPEDYDKREEFVSLILNPLFEGQGEIKPLRTIGKDAVGPDIVPNLAFFQAKAFPCIKEMRFETFLHDRAIEYPSPGPSRVNNVEIDHEGQGIGDLFSGYLAFPVGPLGVMRVLSLVSESLFAKEEYQVDDDSQKPEVGNLLLTPMHEQNNDCMGRHLVEDTYLITDPDAEYPAQVMDGVEAVLPHHWFRYWLKKEGTFPVPGEFVSIVCKAQGIPPHCWWYQETNPFIYSGNWFETDYYTSGIVLAVIEEVDRDQEAGTATYEVTEISTKYDQKQGHGEYQLSKGEQFTCEEVGNVYKIRVKDQDLYLKSSDFLKYELDTRVAVRKEPGVKTKNFTWTNLEPGRRIPGETVTDIMDYDNSMSGKSFEINTSWSIIPITFYIDEE